MKAEFLIKKTGEISPTRINFWVTQAQGEETENDLFSFHEHKSAHT